jgi:hypothetical protein
LEPLVDIIIQAAKAALFIPDAFILNFDLKKLLFKPFHIRYFCQSFINGEFNTTN